MKLFVALLAALAASASAKPFRVITITSPDSQFLPAKDVAVHEFEGIPIPDDVHVGSVKPCHRQRPGAAPASSMPYGPLGSLLSRIGLSSAAPGHPSAVHSIDLDATVTTTRTSLLDEWRHHVEELIHDAHDKVVPLLEGGAVRILPIMDYEDAQMAEDELNDVKWWRSTGEDTWEVKDGNGEWREPRKNERPPLAKAAQHTVEVTHPHVPAHAHAHHAHHHRHGHPRSLTGRIHMALRNLRPSELIALAFVVGAGIGSIIHCFFMLALIGFRRMRCGKEERKARRAARREARKARKEARRQGAIRLEGEEDARAEELPTYDEQGEQLVEKA